jgi:AcrR family transcriptional regulator
MIISHKKQIAAPAPPLAEGRRQRRAIETRMRLFRCALALIAEHGLHNVTVEDITEAADVGKGTFFNYFETKDHVLGVMGEIQLGKLRETAARVSGSKLAIHATLRQLALRLIEEPGQSARLARALIAAFLGSTSVRETMKRNMLEARKTVAGIVHVGQQRGEIDPKLNREKVAMQFLQSILGTVLMWSLHEKPSLATWIDDSFQHFWSAVAASQNEQES